MQDTNVLSPGATGAWIKFLCKAWYSQSRGILTLSVVGWARLFGCTVEQAEKLISELEENDIGDISKEENGYITIINRRMMRDEKKRKDSTARVVAFRNKMKQKCNENGIENDSKDNASENANNEEVIQEDTEKLRERNKNETKMKRSCNTYSSSSSSIIITSNNNSPLFPPEFLQQDCPDGFLNGNSPPHVPTVKKPRKKKAPPDHAKNPYNAEFLSWWEHYPRKEDKLAAWIAWQEMKIYMPSIEEVMDSLLLYAKSSLWMENEGKYICKAHNWIYGKKWEDKPKPWKAETQKTKVYFMPKPL